MIADGVVKDPSVDFMEGRKAWNPEKNPRSTRERPTQSYMSSKLE